MLWQLYLWERPHTRFTGGWVGPGIGADGTEYPTPTRIQSLDHPACSKSLYQLHTPSSSVYFSIFQPFYLQE